MNLPGARGWAQAVLQARDADRRTRQTVWGQCPQRLLQWLLYQRLYNARSKELERVRNDLSSRREPHRRFHAKRCGVAKWFKGPDYAEKSGGADSQLFLLREFRASREPSWRWP